MKKLNFYLLYVLLPIAIISCHQERIDNKTRITTKDSNGNILSEINYVSDTIKEGTVKYYYQSGVIKEEGNFVNGTKDGLYNSYYQDGSIESQILYKNGLRNGISKWYYPNKNYKEISNWKNNKQFGNATFYFKNGNPETFNSYDFDGHNRYLIKYDITGKKILEKGTVLGQFLLDGNFDSIPINSEIKANISVAVPPNCKAYVFVYELNDNTTSKPQSLEIQNNVALFRQVFENQGRHTLITVGQLKEKNDKIIKTDTIYTILNIVK